MNPTARSGKPGAVSRREAIKTVALMTAASAIVPSAMADISPNAEAQSAPFTLPALPYAFDALEPHIDARTMEIHHGRHHKAYVDNLNKAIAQMPGVGGSLVIESLLQNLNALPESVRTAVRNNGGGHYNHSLFWQMMKKNGGGTPRGKLAGAIDQAFGSFSAFSDQFTQVALGRFGSGWAWLNWSQGKLEIVSTANQDSPLMGKAIAGRERTPLLGIDVWEHAYYLHYQNRRADYVKAWFNVINWDFVTERFERLTA